MGTDVPCKLLHVTMDVTDLQTVPKPYLGGYRNKHSGAVYHHASSQTLPTHKEAAGKRAHGARRRCHPTLGIATIDNAEDKAARQLCRETQTVTVAGCSSQTVRESATQVSRPGLALGSCNDR